MKNLYLVDGASGTGKSDLLKWVTENNANDVAYVRKSTTRLQRDYETTDKFLDTTDKFLLDLDFVSEIDFHSREFDYSYRYGGHWYGFQRSDINDQLRRRDNVFVIVRNTGVIRKVVQDYSFIDVIPVFIYTEEPQLEARLRAENFDDAAIKFRLSRSIDALRDYYAHPDVYREVLINVSTAETFHNVVSRMVEKYNRSLAIDPNLVSVMMSFNKDNPALDDYYDAIESAVTSVSMNMKCLRVDKSPGSPRISGEFRRLIDQSRCIIVDLTENKQNVYYELGYAQGQGKTCIITAAEGTRVFFYPKEHKIVFYKSAHDLRVQLSGELAGVLGSIGL